MLPSRVNVLENGVIMSGNTCIQIITSHSNYYIQSVMSHCRKISLIISRKEEAWRTPDIQENFQYDQNILFLQL